MIARQCIGFALTSRNFGLWDSFTERRVTSPEEIEVKEVVWITHVVYTTCFSKYIAIICVLALMKTDRLSIMLCVWTSFLFFAKIMLHSHDFSLSDETAL